MNATAPIAPARVSSVTFDSLARNTALLPAPERAESLVWRIRFWWDPDPWAIREAPFGLWRLRVWWVRRLEAKGLLP
jgi:hypothetical protein